MYCFECIIYLSGGIIIPFYKWANLQRQFTLVWYKVPCSPQGPTLLPAHAANIYFDLLSYSKCKDGLFSLKYRYIDRSTCNGSEGKELFTQEYRTSRNSLALFVIGTLALSVLCAQGRWGSMIPYLVLTSASTSYTYLSPLLPCSGSGKATWWFKVQCLICTIVHSPVNNGSWQMMLICPRGGLVTDRK